MLYTIYKAPAPVSRLLIGVQEGKIKQVLLEKEFLEMLESGELAAADIEGTPYICQAGSAASMEEKSYGQDSADEKSVPNVSGSESYSAKQNAMGDSGAAEREICADEVVTRNTCAWLDRYFAGEQPDPLELPLDPEGSEFRKEVWKILLGIPYGQVVTYGDIARRMAEKRGHKKMAAQAVGGAVGHNPIAPIIPCHRVVGSGGNLTGYGGGLDVKIFLLELEGLDMTRFYRPARGTKL